MDKFHTQEFSLKPIKTSGTDLVQSLFSCVIEPDQLKREGLIGEVLAAVEGKL